jgi:signal transduction histidine kinase
MGMAILCLNQRKGPGTWQLIAANSKAYRIAGSSADAFQKLHIIEHLTLSGSPKLSDVYRDVAIKQRSKLVGHLHSDTVPDANPAFSVSAHPLGSGFIAILFEDISILKQTARKLLDAENLLSNVCETAQVIVWRAEPETLRFTHVTKEARQILGYWLERWHHEVDFWRRHVHPADWETVRKSCALAAAQDSEQRFDCRMFRATSETRWFRVYVKKTFLSPAREELSGVMVDITDQKRVESAARRLSGEIIRAQEQERRRVSRELHDSIGQYLTGLKCTLAAVVRGKECNGEIGEKLRECIDTLGVCIEETRSISQMLHPPALELLGLVPALRAYAEGFSHRTGIELDLDLPDDCERFDVPLETALFRIAQECLTNIQRHARSDFARVRLACDSETITLEIEDRGVGLDPALLERPPQKKNGHGIGLLKMKERVNELNGKLKIDSSGGGAIVHVEIPRRVPPVEIGIGSNATLPASHRD